MPGDNDIGGEEDMVSLQMHERFNYAYTQPDTLVYSSATFFKVLIIDFFKSAKTFLYVYNYINFCIGQQINTNNTRSSKGCISQ